MKNLFAREGFVGKAIGPHIERVLLRSLKRNLRGIYLKGKLIRLPFVLAMNHHNYFDGHLVWLLFRLFGIRSSLLISDENLRASPALEAVGALSTSRIREALRRLQAGEAVAIFPEGEMRPAEATQTGRCLAIGKKWVCPSCPLPTRFGCAVMKIPKPTCLLERL